MTYKYLANLTSDVNGNISVELSENIDFTLDWQSLADGLYQADLPTNLQGKVFCFINQDMQGINSFGIQRIGLDKIAICTYCENVQIHGLLDKTSVQIFVETEDLNSGTI